MPSASQCQTSTVAFASAVQALPVTFETRNVSASVAPGFTAFVVGSERMSERFSFSSTKYGPSVRAGRPTHDGRAVAATALVATAASAAVAPAGQETAAGAHAA